MKLKNDKLLIKQQATNDIFNKTKDLTILGLYISLSLNQTEKGIYKGNQEELAKILNISKTTLNKGIKKLKELGYLEMIRQGHKKDTIYIVYDEKKQRR